MSYQIGDAKITETILESFTPSALLPGLNPDGWEEHPEWTTPGMFSKSKGSILLSLPPSCGPRWLEHSQISRELGSNFSKRHLLQQSLPRNICRTYHLAKRPVPMGLHLIHFYAAL